MFAVCVTFRIKTDQMQVFLPEMMANAAASLANEQGCRQFDVCKERDEVFLYEVYDNRAAFDFHLRTPHFREFDEIVADMIDEKSIKTYDVVTPADAAE